MILYYAELYLSPHLMAGNQTKYLIMNERWWEFRIFSIYGNENVHQVLSGNDNNRLLVSRYCHWELPEANYQ